MTEIRAVAFDLWETLITDTPEQSRKQERLRLQRMDEILAARGHGAKSERIEHAYEQRQQFLVVHCNYNGCSAATTLSMQKYYDRYFGSHNQPQPNQELADRHDGKEPGRHRADHKSIAWHVFPARATAPGLSAVFVYRR